MRQRLLTVANFPIQDLPVALTRAAGQDRASMDAISLFPCQPVETVNSVFLLFQGCRLGHLATWIVAD